MISKTEVDRLHELKREKDVRENAFRLAQLKQAAVKASLLTQNEHWDYYLSLLQGKLDEAKVQELDWMQKCADAHEPKDWSVAQRNYIAWKERGRALEEMMAIPSQMIEGGKLA